MDMHGYTCSHSSLSKRQRMTLKDYKTLTHYTYLVLVLIASCRFASSFSLGQTRCNSKLLSSYNPSDTSLYARSGPRVIIVGGGVGGLAIASRIASSLPNAEVTILEKNEEVGGRTGSFDVNVNGCGVFRHERGPSLLLLPQIYQDLFKETGMGTPEDYGLEMLPCTPAYQVVFDDGDRINVGFSAKSPLSTKQVHVSRTKMDSFEANGAAKWDEYMKICEAYLDCGLPNFIEERFDLGSFPAFLQAALGGFGKAWPLKPHSSVLDVLFSSPKMKALASFQDLYVGLEPYANTERFAGGVLSTTAPAVFGLLAAIELHPTNKKCGVFAPVGGFRAVTQAMKSLSEDLKVEIKNQTTVTKVTSEGVYTSSTDAGPGQSDFVPADFVVVNADLPYAKNTIILDSANEHEPKYDWDDDYRFSCGVIAFHWSVDVALGDLNTHNVFLSAKSEQDCKGSWRVLRGENSTGPFSSSGVPFNFYVHRASDTDPTAAPEVRHLFNLRFHCFIGRPLANSSLSF